jgi:hypothetical protein
MQDLHLGIGVCTKVGAAHTICSPIRCDECEIDACNLPNATLSHHIRKIQSRYGRLNWPPPFLLPCRPRNPPKVSGATCCAYHAALESSKPCGMHVYAAELQTEHGRLVVAGSGSYLVCCDANVGLTHHFDRFVSVSWFRC